MAVVVRQREKWGCNQIPTPKKEELKNEYNLVYINGNRAIRFYLQNTSVKLCNMMKYDYINKGFHKKEELVIVSNFMAKKNYWIQ